MVGCFSGWAGRPRPFCSFFSLSGSGHPSVEAPHPLGQAVDAPAPLAEVRGALGLGGVGLCVEVGALELRPGVAVGNVMPSLPFHVPVTSFGPPLGEKSTFMDCPSLANVAASAHSLTGSPALHAPSEPAPSAPVTL